MRFEPSKSSYSGYFKAGLIFAGTTITFLLAKTTGFFSNWRSKNTSHNDQISTQHHLLQTSSMVTVQTSIPDQIIDASQQYNYNLDNIFSPGFSYLSASPLPPWMSLHYGFTGSLSTPYLAWDVSIESNCALVTAGNTLEVMDISDPSNPLLLSNLTLPGLAYGIATQASLAAIATISPGGVQIVNFSDPRQPVLLASLSMQSGAQNLYWAGSLLYVADTTSGLEIVSLSSPNTPVLQASLSLPGPALAVAVQGAIAYIADGGAGLRLININNASAPSVIGSYAVTGGDQAYDVAVQNTLAVVAYGTSGLRMLNVSNPSAPVLIATIPAVGSVQAVSLQNSLAFVSDTASGLSVWDISKSTKPVLWGSYTVGGTATGIALSNSLLFLACGSSGLQIADLRTGVLTGTPTLLMSGESWIITVTAYGSNMTQVSDSFQLIADQPPYPVNSGITDLSLNPGITFTQTLDTRTLFIDPDGTFLSLALTININKNPTNITLPGFLSLFLNPVVSGSLSLPAGGSAQKVAVQDTVAYVACQGGGILVVSFDNSAAPVLVGSYALSGAKDIIVQESIAYVAGPTGLQILNVSDPTPKLLGTLTSAWPLNGLALLDNVLAWADNGGVQLVNVTNPKIPISFSRFNTTGAAQQVAWQSPIANTLIVADDVYGTQIWNITNLYAPVKLGAVVTPSNAYSVSPFNSTSVVIGDLYAGVILANTTEPSNLQIIGAYWSNQGRPYDVLVQGSVVLVADYDQGLLLIDLSIPTAPRKLGSYRTPGKAYGVAVSGNTAVVAADTALQILDLSNWRLTANPTPADEGNYALTLIVSDVYGGSTSVNFNIRVEGPPRVNGMIPSQFAKVGLVFSYFISQGLVTDPNFDILSFSAELANGQPLPSWLIFNSVSATLTGLPQSSDVGIYNISFIAEDHISGQAKVSFALNVNYLPVLNLPIADQVVGNNNTFLWTLPSSTFTDSNSISTLTYRAQLTTGQSLPSWISFNNLTQSFFGLTNASLTGSYDLSVIVTDIYGGQAHGEFTLFVESLPRLGVKQSSLVIPVGEPFALTLSSALFISDQPLTYTARQAGGIPLPSWLTFKSTTLSFYGVPEAIDLGALSLQVTATDSLGGSTSTEFSVTVRIFPQAIGHIPTPPRFRELKPLLFTLPGELFQDLDGSVVLTYNATLQNDVPLPYWLMFNALNLTFTGWPSQQDIGTLNIKITASDGQGGSASLPMVFEIDPNYPPDVSEPVSNQVANIGEQFTFFVPPGTFTDRNNDNLIYYARQVTGEDLPNWLHFINQNGSYLFSGLPGRGDTNPFSNRIIEVALSANDGLVQTTTSLSITVQGTSTFGWFLRVGGPILSFVGLLLGAYAKRAMCINRYRPNRYQKSPRTITKGQHFELALQTSPERVGKLQVKLPHTAHQCCRFFKHPRELFKSSRDKLPGGFQLPFWMEYDFCTNQLSGQAPLAIHYNQLVVQVKDSAGIILEQFFLNIENPEVEADLVPDQIHSPKESFWDRGRNISPDYSSRLELASLSSASGNLDTGESFTAS